jgi:hypothetical protein
MNNTLVLVQNDDWDFTITFYTTAGAVDTTINGDELKITILANQNDAQAAAILPTQTFTISDAGLTGSYTVHISKTLTAVPTGLYWIQGQRTFAGTGYVKSTTAAQVQIVEDMI